MALNEPLFLPPGGSIFIWGRTNPLTLGTLTPSELRRAVFWPSGDLARPASLRPGTCDIFLEEDSWRTL